jgi:predicted O-methyltransferase YrrM
VASRQPFSARDYYNDPRRKAKSAFVRAASRALRPLGFDFELAHYYSPIPSADDRPPEWWITPKPMPGIEINLDRQLDLIARELAPFISEFTPPRVQADPFRYHLANGLFQGGDADLLYAVIRRFKPEQVLEVGAGFSTLVAALAAERNAAEGHRTRLVSCDPYAIPPAPGTVPGLAELRPVAAEDVPLDEFQALRANDVLFLDSSHTVKVGGDVVHLFCEVLPRLAPGVLVHVHDVYLPWPYPREWVARNRWYWAEQYLLQALLCESPRWEILVTAYALHRERPEQFRSRIPNVGGMPAPLSCWLRRTSG